MPQTNSIYHREQQLMSNLFLGIFQANFLTALISPKLYQ
ncbi:hypothetical protein MNBD_ALPHA11-912 [hydrothermal vent metagenome]|uniref:Uncharacterized protein n=1 Tax=hydrothermal vent metagenome TaxID=652676 RepID=A0A3B0TT44_9ZZZZ